MERCGLNVDGLMDDGLEVDGLKEDGLEEDGLEDDGIVSECSWAIGWRVNCGPWSSSVLLCHWPLA